ncbi:MAG: glycosyltransferase family 2 protein [Candidatus Omnitrophica bacterium]|nr:glycosyltransferase family 2 protein [Candidatus Omnitrophota bacterium]
MKVCVLIPTYNEAKTIGWLIRRIKELGINEIVVVDDGSTDNTVQLAKDNGAEVLRNINNLGKGNSLRRGFSYCLEKNFDIVITIDGDGQHSPEEIPHFIDFFKHHRVDVIVGNRMHHPEGMPLIRFLTNKLMSKIISFLIHQEIPDTQCGLRLLRREVLEKINLRTDNFEIESEILIEAGRRGFVVFSLPIKTIYLHETISQINPILDSLRFINFVFKIILRW